MRSPREQQGLHVLPALGPFAAGGIAVGQLIHQNELGAALEHGGHIQLLKPHATVAEPFAGNLLQPLGLAGGFAAAVGFEQADHHIAAVPEPFVSLLQHAAGLAHPRRHADEHLVAAAPMRGADHDRLVPVRRGAGAVALS
jgi:hypothetical protein